MNQFLMSSFATGAASSIAVGAPSLFLEQSSGWSGGYTASITIENPHGQPAIDGWSLQWVDGPAIENLWNGVRSVNGDTTTVVNESWNGRIEPGSSRSTGFTAEGEWPPSFSELSYNNMSISMTDITEGGDGSDGSSGGDDGSGSSESLGFPDLTTSAVVVSLGNSTFSLTSGQNASLSAHTNNPDVLGVSIDGNQLVIHAKASGFASVRVDDATSGDRVLLGVAVRGGDGNMPGLPDYLAVGSVSEDVESHLEFFRDFGLGDTNRRVDVRYIYINGGPINGWRTWTPEEGQRVSNYIRNSKQLGMIPCLIWYNVPDGGESYWTNSEHLFDPEYMSAYWQDLDFMLDLAHAETQDGWPVMIVLEPDLLGYFAQAGLSPHESSWSVGITGSPQVSSAYSTIGVGGEPILAAGEDPAFDNSIEGLVKAINYIIDRDLPAGIVGWQFNLWASPPGGHTGVGVPGTGLVHLSDTVGIDEGRAAIAAEAQAMAQWYVDAGVMSHGADFISLDKYGLDAAGTTSSAADDPASSAWFWNNDHWLNYLEVAKSVGEVAQAPTVLWQIPVGHINESQVVDGDGLAFPVLENTHQHYEDSAGTFFLGDTFVSSGDRFDHFSANDSGDPLVSSSGNAITWGSHMQEAADAGVVAVLFGAGVGSSTQGTPRSDTIAGDPTDGGWWITKVQRYYEHVVPLSSQDGSGNDSQCEHDLNADNAVDISDVLILISSWGLCSDPTNCASDFDGNGSVDVDDLLVMVVAFGSCVAGGGSDNGGDNPGGGGDDNGDGNPGDGGNDNGGGSSSDGGDDAGNSGGETDPDDRIVAYYIEWGVYGRDYQPSDIPVDKITHLNYAFANIDDDGRIAIGDPYAAIDKSYPGDTWDQPYRGTYNQINNVLKAAHPHLKTLISVGGWTWSGRFSDVALTEISRRKFAESCVNFIRTYNFDGVDIDWEYPVCCGLSGNTYRPEDRDNYTLLMEELRSQLDAAAAEDGSEYLLTIAAAGGVDKLANYDLVGIAAQCDWINTMSYDFAGAWDLSITRHHSGLYANTSNPSSNENVRLHYNTKGSVQPWLDAGVDPHKIVMGVPFYGRAWGGVGSNNGGLFQSGSTVPPGTWDDWSSGATGINDFSQIEELLASGNYTRYWDNQAKVPWLYSASQHGGHFISYDDAESMQHKVDYVEDLDLGGIMFWEITGDRNDVLLDVIHDGLLE
ncbi:MAG: glycosyl hydrolase family 18 protein [Phycisphaerales bacterium]|nr:glycosyl hydrolase family 18 protein [Phycisphaerales bacterium]